MFKNRKGEDIDVVYASGRGSFGVNWGIAKCGFGELSAYLDKERNVMVFDSEYMGRETVKAILCKLVDDGFFPDFEEYEKMGKKLTVVQLNEYNAFGTNHSLCLPFYAEVVKEDESLVELRWNVTSKYAGIDDKEGVLSVQVNSALVQEKLAVHKEKLRLEKLEKNKGLATTSITITSGNEEDTEEDEEDVETIDNSEETVAEENSFPFDLFSYAFMIKKTGFDNEVINCTESIFIIKEKERN
jgi:hypothetical protein